MPENPNAALRGGGLLGLRGGRDAAAAAASVSRSLKNRVMEALAEPKLRCTATWGLNQAESCFWLLACCDTVDGLGQGFYFRDSGASIFKMHVGEQAEMLGCCNTVDGRDQVSMQGLAVPISMMCK
jgi:hypothetical protein